MKTILKIYNWIMSFFMNKEIENAEVETSDENQVINKSVRYKSCFSGRLKYRKVPTIQP